MLFLLGIIIGVVLAIGALICCAGVINESMIEHLPYNETKDSGDNTGEGRV